MRLPLDYVFKSLASNTSYTNSGIRFVSAQSVHYIPYRIGDKWVITNSMGEHLTNKLDYEIFPAMINRIKFKDGDKFGI